MSKLLKIGGAALAAVGAGTGVVSTVVNVVEIINYEDHYEINRTTKYYVDGEEVDFMTYDELAGFDVGYGKVKDTENITLDDFTAVHLNGTAYTFTCKIVCGDPIEEVGEYPVFAVPATYTVDAIINEVNLLDFFTVSELDGYNVYTYESVVYDEDVGGDTWKVTFSPAQ